MKKDWAADGKRLKHRFLSQFPGRMGRRYKRKFVNAEAMREFDRTVGFAEGKTCIDLGANVGNFTRKMASVAGHVIAFEPDPWAVAILRANIVDFTNVTIMPMAVGTTDGAVHLYRHPQFDEDPARYSESSSVLAEKRNVDEESAVPVPQIDFLHYLEDLAEDVWLLKIDIEGAEVDLLEALLERPDLLRRVSHIFAETHEHRVPGHLSRVATLRERSRRITKPNINLNWA